MLFYVRKMCVNILETEFQKGLPSGWTLLSKSVSTGFWPLTAGQMQSVHLWPSSQTPFLWTSCREKRITKEKNPSFYLAFLLRISIKNQASVNLLLYIFASRVGVRKSQSGNIYYILFGGGMACRWDFEGLQPNPDPEAAVEYCLSA